MIDNHPPIENIDFDNWMIKFVKLFNDREHINYTPTSVTLNTGTSSDTVSDVQTLFDGNIFDVAEVTGTPGFDIEFNFTDVLLLPEKILMRLRYSGSATHGVGVDIYNEDSLAWDRYSHFTDHATDDYAWIEVTVPDMSSYMDSSNNMTLRLYHYTAGNAAHNLYIDYVGLRT